MITVPSPLAWVAAAASLPVSLLVPLLPCGRSHDSRSPLLHFVPAPGSASPSHPPRKQVPKTAPKALRSSPLPSPPSGLAFPSRRCLLRSRPGPGGASPDPLGAYLPTYVHCPPRCPPSPAPAALRATEAGARHAVGYPAPHVPGTKPVEEEITYLIVTHRNFYKGKRYHHCY